MAALIDNMKASSGGCCWNPVWASVLGIDPPPSPPAPPTLRFYYVDLTPTAPGADILVAGTYGSNGFATGDSVGIATWLQANVTAESGAWGIEIYTLWVALADAPGEWTWNGDPVSFTEVGEVSQACYTTGDFGFSVAYPNSADWYMLFINSQFGGVAEYSGGLFYNDPDFATKFQTFITQISGANAIASSTITVDRVTLTVADTYLVFDQVQNYDPDTNQQLNPFGICP